MSSIYERGWYDRRTREQQHHHRDDPDGSNDSNSKRDGTCIVRFDPESRFRLDIKHSPTYLGRSISCFDRAPRVGRPNSCSRPFANRESTTTSTECCTSASSHLSSCTYPTLWLSRERERPTRCSKLATTTATSRWSLLRYWRIERSSSISTYEPSRNSHDSTTSAAAAETCSSSTCNCQIDASRSSSFARTSSNSVSTSCACLYSATECSCTTAATTH